MRKKLIDILVEELPGRGGWPGTAVHAWADTDGEIRFRGNGTFGDFYPKGEVDFQSRVTSNRHENTLRYIITRAQYETALAAKNAVVWSGDGLPPVGCECEALYDSSRGEWKKCRIVAVDSGWVFGFWDFNLPLTYESDASDFRPLRTEADRKRDEAIEEITRLISGPSQASATANKLYDAIAAGKIPAVKLED